MTADPRAVTVRRLTVRAASRSEAEAVAAAFGAGLAMPLAGSPGWDGGARAALRVLAPGPGGAGAGEAAAEALRGRLTGGAHG